MHSERLATTITAQLIDWKLRENGGVEGTIYESDAPEYKEGEHYIFLNTRMQHWPACEGFWPDHFIMTTQTGRYHFMLKDKDKHV